MTYATSSPVRLTYQTLKEHRRDLGSLVLSKFHLIEERAAVVLPLLLGTRRRLSDILTNRRAPIFPLYLGGLTELSTPAAIGLARHEGYLQLTGLNNLTDGAARALSLHCGTLHLGGITHLTEAASKYLAQHRGPLQCAELLYQISLLNSKYPSPSFTSAFSEDSMAMSWIRTSLEKRPVRLKTTDLLEIVHPTPNGYLGLGGIQSLSDASLGHFANHVGNLNLSGLTNLSIEGAESLSRHTGDLHLHGLVALSDRQAEAISALKGTLYLRRDIQMSNRAERLLVRVRN